MKTAAEITAFIGKPRIMAAFGISRRRMDECCQNNRFPASWYDAMERMAGRPLDRRLFTFKGSDA